MSNEIEILLKLQSMDALNNLNNFVNQAQAGLKQLAAGGAVVEVLEKVYEVAKAIVERIGESIEHVVQLSEAAQKIGMPVDQLSALDLAAKQSGVSVEEIAKSMRGLGKAITDSENPASTIARTFEQLGISVKGQNGQLISEEQLLMRLADAFKAMPDGIGKVTIATELLGKSGQQMIPLLNQGSDGIRRAMTEAQEFGLVVGPEFAEQAEHWHANVTRMQAEVEGFWRVLASNLLPTLNAVSDWTIDWTKKNLDLNTGLSMIATVATADAAAIKAFLGSLSQGATVAQAWQNALSAVDDTMADLQKRIQERLFPQSGAAAGAGGKTPQELRDEMNVALKKLDNQIAESKNFESMAKNDPDNSPAKQLQITNQEITIQIGLIRQRNDEIQKGMANGAIDRLSGQSQILGNDSKIDTLRAQLKPETFSDQMEVGLGNMYKQLTNLTSNTTIAALRTLQSGVDAVTNAIAQAATGTKNWGQNFVQAMDQAVGGIVKMVAQWVAGQAAMMAVNLASASQSKSNSASTAAASAPAMIGKFGEQGGWVGILVGIGVYLAAMAAIMAVVGQIGARAAGGPVVAGMPYVVGERNAELFVPETNGTIMPHVPAAMASRFGGGGFGGSSSSQAPINLHFHGSEESALKAMRSTKGQNILVDQNRKTIKRVMGM